MGIKESGNGSWVTGSGSWVTGSGVGVQKAVSLMAKSDSKILLWVRGKLSNKPQDFNLLCVHVYSPKLYNY